MEGRHRIEVSSLPLYIKRAMFQSRVIRSPCLDASPRLIARLPLALVIAPSPVRRVSFGSTLRASLRHRPARRRPRLVQSGPARRTSEYRIGDPDPQPPMLPNAWRGFSSGQRHHVPVFASRRRPPTPTCHRRSPHQPCRRCAGLAGRTASRVPSTSPPMRRSGAMRWRVPSRCGRAMTGAEPCGPANT
ncbi:hypothetical protein PTE31013_02775 [Pandoraea terrigena]|uniref:Uncharacterized protein n=1 Tax=Pandoraea terrigena TaxID=2508292 RepID=A0A5E4VQE3_9BURK|nr:hypothetical protein PTE31013_02775 [Pandoraea terrigena]